MKIPVTYAGLAVAAILLMTALMGFSPPPERTPPQQDDPVEAVTVSAPKRAPGHTPRTRLLFNDPRRDAHAITEAITANIDATPAGQTIDVSTYLIDSPRIATALTRAHRRGVAVRVILDGARRTSSSRALARALNAERDRSWLIWSRSAARGTGGHMHEKTFRFSRVGDADWVTVTGSHNVSDLADRSSYATMWQITDRREIYDAFAAISAQQRAQRSPARPFRAYDGNGWSAYFLPSGAMGAGRDPVLARLARIPADRSSEIRVAMFSMWDERGETIAARLADLARGGARVTFVAGPTVSPIVVDILRAGGVKVRSGCYADRRYAHGKDMSATYLVRGERQFWTWVGSDNWTSRGMESDQAVLGLKSVGYRTFARAFALLTARGDGVFGDACSPNLGWDG